MVTEVKVHVCVFGVLLIHNSPLKVLYIEM